MWVIFNDTKNMYWNSNEKKWVREDTATSFNSHKKAEKEMFYVIAKPGDVINIIPFTYNFFY